MPKQRRMNKQARLELVRSYREEYMSAGRGRRGGDSLLSAREHKLQSQVPHPSVARQVQASRSAQAARATLWCFPGLRRIRRRLRQDELRLLRRRPRPHNERRCQIYAQIERLFHLPNAAPGITGDVHDTLTFPLSS